VRAIAFLFSTFGAAGCVGPAALRSTRAQYNEAIRVTSDEQMLRNLVRVRYGDTLVFLNLTSVSTQFSMDQSGSISGMLNENVGRGGASNPDSLGLSASAAFSERPTITYQPLMGEQFVSRMLTPITLEVVVMMTAAGWGHERVFRTIIYQANGLENPIGPSLLTPDIDERADDFAEFARCFARLRKNRLFSLGVKSRQVLLSAGIPAQAVSGDQILAAAENGRKLIPSNDGRTYALVEEELVPVVSIVPDGRDDPDARIFLDLLDLDPELDEYELRSTLIGLPEPRDPSQRRDLRIATRSLLNVMISLSEGIEVPGKHLQAGLVKTYINSDGEVIDRSQYVQDLLHIRSSLYPPKDAAVAIRYRGYWFYIANDDPDSKNTFSMLTALFSLLGGQAGSAQAPVLTLPVSG
jgi:hypothetical protein